jgi:hypothetical protein
MQLRINNAIQENDISSLRAGIYFLRGAKEDGEMINLKLVKQ